jgi:hypothetical protein
MNKTKKKKLSEKEAWLDILNWLKKHNNTIFNGMCARIETLRFRNVITETTYNSMKNKVLLSLNNKGLKEGDYLFPITVKGRQQRMKYCRDKIRYL